MGRLKSSSLLGVDPQPKPAAHKCRNATSTLIPRLERMNGKPEEVHDEFAAFEERALADAEAEAKAQIAKRQELEIKIKPTGFDISEHGDEEVESMAKWGTMKGDTVLHHELF